MDVRTFLPKEKPKPCVLALGNFDGVHLGHRKLLESGLMKAKQAEVDFGVFVFNPHPIKVLSPEQGIKLLTTHEERLHLFERLGVDIVYSFPFTRKMANTNPEKFVQDILVPLRVVHVIVGFNYSFGAQGKGNPEELQKLGQIYGFGVSVLQAQSINGHLISSSSVRKALAHGDIALAKSMLGRPPCLCGVVVKGEQRGRLLGYPTANLQPPDDLLVPKRGAYAVWAEIEGKKVLGMMNIGMKPTFHKIYQTTIEIHFFNFSGNLYEKELTIHIEERIRDERKFSGIEELEHQLSKDSEQALFILTHSH